MTLCASSAGSRRDARERILRAVFFVDCWYAAGSVLKWRKPVMRLPRPASLVAFAGVAGLAGTPALAQPSFTGLGDLPGGQVYSEAWGVSADGSAVVGSSVISGKIGRASCRERV